MDLGKSIAGSVGIALRGGLVVAGIAAGLAGVGASFSVVTGVAFAQTQTYTDAQGNVVDADSVDRGRRLFRDRANCKFCHGWNGQGSLVEGEPPAPALTTTTLGRNDLIETVACGRPGRTMPVHLPEAWTPAHPCYGGLLEKDIGTDQMPRKPFGTLSLDQISDVVNYVLAVYKGKEMTYSNCVAFFNNTPTHECDQYPH